MVDLFECGNVRASIDDSGAGHVNLGNGNITVSRERLRDFLIALTLDATEALRLLSEYERKLTWG